MDGKATEKGFGVLPRAIAHAAEAYAKCPKKLGEVVIALVAGGEGRGLDEGQRVVLSLCREEIDERLARRRAEAERKARSRTRRKEAEND